MRYLERLLPAYPMPPSDRKQRDPHHQQKNAAQQQAEKNPQFLNMRRIRPRRMPHRLVHCCAVPSLFGRMVPLFCSRESERTGVAAFGSSWFSERTKVTICQTWYSGIFPPHVGMPLGLPFTIVSKIFSGSLP